MTRITLTIVLLLLLGAIVNVAVAWSLAIWIDHPSGGDYQELSVGSRWPHRVPKHWSPPTLGWSKSKVGVTTRNSRGHDHLVEGAPTDRSSLYMQYLVQVGLPLRTMEGGAVSVVSPGPPYQRIDRDVAILWQVPAVLRPATPYQSIPLRPVWPGFPINTIFYVVIWFSMIVGFGAARRKLRTRRGHCPKCNYDLRGGLDRGCPECGWNRNESHLVHTAGHGEKERAP